MAYTVFARKYRPQTFEDLVGQEHVTRTLGNAIETDRVAHAFLFTGVRGVGKTTTARLLAKALNCEKGPTATPCNECDECVGIANGTSTDVQEMDGASNNSVDDVRRLQESLPYRPQSARFKVVIVDEVHMLSTGAFNAFLKTLEEPPAHVKFIFATTEVHKVPVTIRSRCQRYDFRLIRQQVVASRVREILDNESISADEAAIALVAREAAGSMRDALTLLDQIVAFGGNELAGEEVARVLGIAEREKVFAVAEAILVGDGAAVLGHVDELAARGLDMLHFAKQLLELMRDMVVLRVSGEQTELVAMVDEERSRAAKAAGAVDVQELHRAFSALSRVVEDVAQSGMPRTMLEMGLVRLATRPALLPVAELVARLDAMERRHGGGGGGGGGARRDAGGGGHSSPSGPGASAQSARPASTRAEPAPPARPEPAASAQTEPARPEPAASAQTEPARPEPAAPRRAEPEPAASPRAEAAPTPARADFAAPADPEPAAPVRADFAAPADPESAAPVLAEPEPTPPPIRPEPTEVAAPDPDPPPPASAWHALVDRMMATKPALGAVLQHGSPVEVGPDKLVLGFLPGSFFRRQAEAPESLAAIASVAEQVLGGRPTVEVVEHDGGSGESKTIVEAMNEEREERMRAAIERARNHPLVAEAAALFSVSRDEMKVHVELE